MKVMMTVIKYGLMASGVLMTLILIYFSGIYAYMSLM